MSDFLVVGRIRKPHGIHGELVVSVSCDEPDAIFAPGRLIFIGDIAGNISADPKSVVINRSRPFKDAWLIGFEGVRDRNEAELWRGLHLIARAEDVAPPEEGEYFLHELPGMSVHHVNGTVLGPVANVETVPQGFLLNVQIGDKIVSVPFVDEIVTDIDRDTRTITIDPPEGLLEL